MFSGDERWNCENLGGRDESGIFARKPKCLLIERRAGTKSSPSIFQLGAMSLMQSLG